MKNLARGAVVAGLFAVAFVCPIAAQDATDILTGRVTDEVGRAIEGALIRVFSLDTEITRQTLTDEEGKYVLLFPDGGGRYEMLVSFLGYEDRIVAVVRQADEEVLIAEVTLSADPLNLEGLDVDVRRTGPPGNQNAGSRGITLTQALINRLPISDFDPAFIAALAPGVILTQADTTNGIAGFSVAGQRDALNQITLDGGSVNSVLTGQQGVSPVGLPEEGVRATRVMTNTYDVSRGQFSGGLVAMTTSRGVNRFGGSVSYNVRDPALQGGTTGLQSSFSQNRVSGGVGGPIARDHIFYNVSFTAQRRVDELFSLTPGGPVSPLRVGVNADSIARFMDILEGGYGMSTDGQTGPFDRTGDALSLLARVDFNGWERHTLMVRANGSLYDQNNARIGSLEVLENGGDVTSESAGGMISLGSRLGGSWINQGRISINQMRADQTPYVLLPEGRVRINSDLDPGAFAGAGGVGGPGARGGSTGRGGARGVSTMAFGGDRDLPAGSFERTVEITDELSFLLGFTHRLKIGVLANHVEFEREATSDLYGTFHFNSLGDLEAMAPASYTRSLVPQIGTGSSTAWATYVGDTWRPRDPLQITMGVRLEGTDYGGLPERNGDIERTFGRRTDFVPSELHVSPRIGFSYRLSEPNTPLKLLRGGVGEFRGRTPLSLFAAAQEQTGLTGSEIQLVCAGQSVPTPAWDLYRTDPSAIPATCADGMVTGPQSTLQPNVTTFSPDFTAPRSIRASLGYQAAVGTRLSASIDAMYARGVSLYGVRDLNLDTSVSATLAAETGRPFFGDVGSIVPQTGQVSTLGSRLDPEYRHVFDINSTLSSSTTQISAGVGGTFGRGAILQASYTLSRSTDESSFSCCSASQGFQSATTGGHPNEPEWGTSSFERRHAFTALMAMPVGRWLDLSLIGRLGSGAPFTPMVAGDINGDGARNDRAFVFDPETVADPAVAASIAALIEAVPGRIRDCLESQMGRIASRNSCRGEWTSSLDMSATVRPSIAFAGLDDRLTISVDVSNLPAGLDLLLHGNDDLHGWGQPSRPDPTLLVPTGWDPEARAYIYDVNEQFGQSFQGRIGRGSPFQLQITARMALGASIGGLFGGGGGFGGRGGAGLTGGLGGARGGGAGIGGRGGLSGGRGGIGSAGGRGGGLRGGLGGRRTGGLGGPGRLSERLLANPVPIVLELADTLGLSDEQRAAVRELADQLDATLAATIEKIRSAMEQIDEQAEAEESIRLLRELQPEIRAGRNAIQAAMEAVEEILTENQWQSLPAALRNPIRAGARSRGG